MWSCSEVATCTARVIAEPPVNLPVGSPETIAVERTDPDEAPDC
jgi:hypothetical protein